jgi:hypothetical protein
LAVLPGTLRVVGRDDTLQQQQTMDAARAQAYARPLDSAQLAPVGLAGFISDQYSIMRRHRDTVGRGWSDRLLASLRAFNGIYDQNVIQEIKKFGGSNVYARIIAMKCRGTSALLRDVYLGTDKPWGLEPSSDPEVPDEVVQAIAQHIGEVVTQQIEAHFDAAKAQVAHQVGTAAAQAAGARGFAPPGASPGAPVSPAFVDAAIPSQASGPSQGMHTGAIPPGAAAPPGAGAGLPPPPPPPPLPDPNQVRDVYDLMMSDARDAARRKANDQCKVAQDKLEELLAMGGFYNALAEFLVDLPMFPYACLKGPTVRIKTQVKWTKDVAPWGNSPNGGAVSQALPSNPSTDLPLPNSPLSASANGQPSSPDTPTPPAASGGTFGVTGAGGVTPGVSPPLGLNPGRNSAISATPQKPLSQGGLSNSSTQGAVNPQAQLAKPTVQDVPVLTWERVSPFDVYWTPGVAQIEDANIIQRSRLTRAELNTLLDLPGFLSEEVRAVLDEYGRGGLVDNWDQTDSERSILEGREDPRFNQSGLIACLEFQGNAQGRFLLDLGMDPSEIPDPLRDYFCNAWLIGRHIIKVQLIPSPRKRHQYYITSFEKIPGTPAGNGLPDLLADVSSVTNATLRALVNNLSISSGPQVIVNDDRLGDGENGEDMYPWKRWHVKSDPFGNNTEKAVEFFSPASNAQELLAVYQAFSAMADEASAIPKFMTGSPPSGGLGRTASGLSMLMQNSSKILQTVASNIDIDVVEPVINALVDMVMLTDQTGLLTGEEKVRVLGVQVAQQRETQRARQLEFLQMTANPIDMGIIGVKGRAQVLRSVATEIGLPGENIVPSDSDLNQKEQQQQAMMAQGGPPGAHPGGPIAGPPVPPGQGGPPQTPPNVGASGPAQIAQGGAPPAPAPQPGQPRANLVNQGGPTH